MQKTDPIEFLKFQTQAALMVQLMNARLISAWAFIHKAAAIIGASKTNPLQIDQVLRDEAKFCCQFLQTYSRRAGNPIVHYHSTDSTEYELIDPAMLDAGAIDGITIVIPCNGALAKQVVEAIDRVIEGSETSES